MGAVTVHAAVWRAGRRLRPSQTNLARLHRISQQARRELDRPPMGEWEIDAAYEAVLIERMMAVDAARGIG